MEPTATEHAQNPVFAAPGGRRHWLIRWAIIGGAALLAAWLTSLALGIVAGYDGLPGLPSVSSGGSKESHSSAPATHPVAAPLARVSSTSEAGSTPPRGSGVDRKPRRSSTPRAAAPSGASSRRGGSTTHGQGAGTSKPAGKPAGSPGNGPGGSGPPGHLR